MSSITATKAAESARPARHSLIRGTSPGFLTSISTVFAGQIACAVVALAIEVMCARILGPDGRGQMALCAMAIALGTLVGGLGGEIPIVLWAASDARQFHRWMPSIVLLGAVGSAIAVLIWIVAYRAGSAHFLRGVTPALVWIVAAAIPVSVAFNYLVAVLTGFEQFRARATISFFTQIAEFVTIATLLFWFQRSAASAILGVLAGFLVGIVVTVVMLRQRTHFSWPATGIAEKFLPALNLGLRGQLGDLATFFTYRLDVFIVNFFLGPADVGIYAVGVVMSEALWQVPQAAAVVLFPRSARRPDDDAAAFTCTVSRHILIIAIVAGLGIALAAPIAIPLLFGPQFGRAVRVIWWILPGTVALSLGKLMSAELAARGVPQFSSIFALVALAVTVILDFALIPKMSIQGAAIASSAAYIVDTVLLAAKTREVLGVSWKRLLTPTRSEFAAYVELWARCRNWLGAAFAA
jgi:O-antigen/teichoic acid export membrane protein